MTTDTAPAPRVTGPDPGTAVLAQALAITLGAGLAAAALALAVDGGPGALGVLAGLGIAVTVFALGSFTVNAVARILPSAALLVAMLTYALQLLVLLLVLAAVERSGALAQTLDRAWLGGALIGATLVWMAAQIVLHVRRRSLAYDLPAPASAGPTDGDA